MSLSISQNYTAIGPNLTASFQASGGVAPYVFSVVGGGAGGTIDSSTGVYTAPNNTGIDTIQVMDSLAIVVQSTILIGTALELFCDIIATYMDLSQGQIYLWDQKIDIPNDSRLYVVVGVLSCKPFGNSTKMDANGNSIQSVNMQAMLNVDIFSRGPAARDLKEQVILALQSQYAQSQQEANSFYVGKISSTFNNLSELEGSAILYRFNISVQIQYFITNSEAAPYFDQFSTPQVNTNP